MQSLSERALERRLKRHLIRADQRFYLTTLPGLEEALAAEAAALGYPNGEVGAAGVGLTAPFSAVYELNLHLRLAQRVLLEIESFPGAGMNELYNQASSVAWERYVGFVPTVGIQVKARRSPGLDLVQAEKVLFKAVRNRMKQHGLAITRDDESPLRLLLRATDGRYSLAVDASASNLGARDYAGAARSKMPGTALAGFLRWAGVAEAGAVFDPFCRDGALIIEAAAAAAGLPLNTSRSWGFQSWPGFREGPYERAREAREARPGTKSHFFAADRKASKIAAAKAGADALGLGESIQFELRDFKSLRGHPAREQSPGAIVTWAPGGGPGARRGQVTKLFARMAKLLPENFPDWRMAVMMNEDEALISELPLVETERRELRLGKKTVVWIRGQIARAKTNGKKGKGT